MYLSYRFSSFQTGTDQEQERNKSSAICDMSCGFFSSCLPTCLKCKKMPISCCQSCQKMTIPPWLPCLRTNNTTNTNIEMGATVSPTGPNSTVQPNSMNHTVPSNLSNPNHRSYQLLEHDHNAIRTYQQLNHGQSQTNQINPHMN